MTYIPHEGPQADLLAMRDVPEILFGGARGGGKLLSLQEWLPIPTGYVQLKDLSVGDTLFDENGELCTVLELHPINLSPVSYRVHFDDGSHIDACEEHLWLTYDKKERVSQLRRTEEFRANRRANRPSRAKENPTNRGAQQSVTILNKERKYEYLAVSTGTVRTTREILETLRCPNGEVNHSIPVTKPIVLPHRKLSIPPYVLGAWLGDGNRHDGILTGIDPEIWEEIEKEGFKVTHSAYCAKRHNILGLKKLLKANNLYLNKHIPMEYLRASKEQRLALLQGLMDTDGTVTDSGCAEFCNTNKQIIDGVYDLICSLGWKARVREGRSKLNGIDKGPKWQIKWTPSEVVFRLSRKAAKQRIAKGCTTKWRYIVKVESIEPIPMRCIKVSSPNSLFLVSKAYIPTHNTAALLGDFLQDVARYGEHWQGMLFRRSYPELEEVIKQSHKFYALTGAYWRASSKSWHWGNGACLRLRSLETREDASKYQGFEASWIGWDELTNWSYPDMFFQMFACLRGSGQQVASRVRCSGNPGGPGHNWVKDRYAIGEHKKGWFPIYDEETNMTRLYIPSRTTDNPSLILNSPNYTRQLRAVGSKELVRAWLEGDWDIVLGAYFDEFNERVHVIDDIELTDLPKAWNIYRAYDHGSYHPFAVLWYTYAGREMKEFEPGTLIILREWFGADENGKGLKLSVADIADGIRRREKDFKREVKPGPADNQIFENDGGMPLSEIMAGRGVYFERSDKRRIVGWNQLRYRLQANLVKFCRSCKTLRLTLPTLQHDDIRQEDVDTTGNDHCFVGNTLVDMAVGRRAISSLPEEGYVQTLSGISFFDRCGLKQKGVPVVEIRFIDGRKVRCTPDHRFMTPAGWIEAKDLMGEGGTTARVLCRKSGYAQVRSVEDAGVADVYCMRVPTLGHFCIENGLVVSNCADALRYAAMSWPIEVQTERVKDDVRDIRTFNELIDASDDLLNRVRKPL